MSSPADEQIWEVGYDGHEAAQRRRMAALPFHVKVEWLEEAQEIVEYLRRSRAGAAAAPATGVVRERPPDEGDPHDEDEASA